MPSKTAHSATRRDALVLVVSEERGVISAAQHGRMEELTSPADLKNRIETFWRNLHPPRGLWWTFAYRVAPVHRTYEVPIELRNLPDGWTVDASPTAANVTLSGREREFGLLDAEQVAFSLDLGQISQQGEFSSSQEIALTEEELENVPRGIEATVIEPSTVRLETSQCGHGWCERLTSCRGERSALSPARTFTSEL